MIPPVVWTAGLLRASSQTITTTDWAWIASLTGQVLFQPPNVSGWDYDQWLDTSRWAGRLQAVNTALGATVSCRARPTRSGSRRTRARPTTTRSPSGADSRCLSLARNHLLDLGRRIAHGQTQDWEQVEFRILRQNALRKPDPDDTRLDDRMSTSNNYCDGFARSQAIRRVLASGEQPGRARMGLAHADPGRRRHRPPPVPDRSRRRTGDRLWRRALPASPTGMLGDGIARAATLQPSNSPILVSLFLQGGVDSLSLLAPAGDPLYEKLRPTLAVEPGIGHAVP